MHKKWIPEFACYRTWKLITMVIERLTCTQLLTGIFCLEPVSSFQSTYLENLLSLHKYWLLIEIFIESVLFSVTGERYFSSLRIRLYFQTGKKIRHKNLNIYFPFISVRFTSLCVH